MPWSVPPEAISRLLADPTFAESARLVAAALRELPPPAEAMRLLTGLAG